MKNEFIAWDKKHKHFIPSYHVAINSVGDTYLHDPSSDVDGYTKLVDYIEILEYSGKCDKNGTKLYKGDIVKVELDECPGKFGDLDDTDLCRKKIIGVVTIRPSQGAKLIVKKVSPKHVQGISKGGTLSIDSLRDLRIGHIYPNPELLEEDIEMTEEK